jgi:hypothetical protein
MEVPATYQHGQLITNHPDGDPGMAFLENYVLESARIRNKRYVFN